MLNTPKSSLHLLLVVGAVVISTEAFTAQHHVGHAFLKNPTFSETCCHMAKKKGSKGGKPKGFGATEAPKKQAAATATTESAEAPMATEPVPKIETPMTTIQAQAPSQPMETRPETDDMIMGKRALERLRREQAEKKDAELRRVKDIIDTDKMLQSSPEAAAIPEKVAMRMGKRMLPFVGIPLFGSMGAFVAFWYLATYKDMEFQPGAVATTTIVILASGLLVSADKKSSELSLKIRFLDAANRNPPLTLLPSAIFCSSDMRAS
jgi:hypothetical protein